MKNLFLTMCNSEISNTDCPPKNRNKERMSPLLFIIVLNGLPSAIKQGKKEIKERRTHRLKLSSFTNNIIISIESPKNLPEKSHLIKLIMNSARLQYTKSVYKKQWHFYTLAANY